ncbi:nitrite reductase (NAD(P)H) small subunit [Pseudoclavibacter sp. AY1F1]|uniref:nitrite reductase small subunit NirD n=1 Tax=Pseudoclavibacter sp. AY1F1 TaxID=2080583 RepID=UPI000CE8FB49|nr:nitrite reductase small subunit NirD [Pseudoclavibacter sp. AY1F1]PPF46925.1 nitrite reductase (NAD(P)H) small subunit [Pseudoclavibacter sp. AY1F1]
MTIALDTRGTAFDHLLEDAPQRWVAVCPIQALHPERGVAAILDGTQIALFRLGDDRVFAVQQADPYSGAQVMSRGLIGTRGASVTVASPMFKQVFDLATGECLDTVGKDARTLSTYPVRIEDGTVLVDMGIGIEGRQSR